MEVHDTVPAGDGGPYAAALPRLVQETELQKSLADEKMRSEQHKTHYQILKAEHARWFELKFWRWNNMIIYLQIFDSNELWLSNWI